MLAIHVILEEFGLVFLSPFFMYPLSLQELGSDNTAFLHLFTILLSLIFYGP